MTLKVIAGINNFDTQRVAMIAEAAQQTNAWALDIACDKAVFDAAKNAFKGQLFVSSVDVDKLVDAVSWGADGVELGNFDALYEEGVFLTAQDVMDLAKSLMARLQGQAKISITIPGHLAQDTQAAMATELSRMGVDFIQTEGSARLLSGLPEVKVLDAAEKAELTFTNTAVIANVSLVAVMTASGLTPDNVTRAFNAGASAVGVGAAINRQASVKEMVAVIEQFQTAIATYQPEKAVATA